MDERIAERDEAGVVKSLVEGEKKKPLIQILRDGCWFIHRNPKKDRGLGKDPLESLKAALKKR